MESPLILVTGADGLVGRYVTRLLSQFHRVVAISRHGAFTREDGIHSINVDLGVALEVQRIADIRPDLIVHLAAALPVGPNDAAVASVNQLIDLHIFNLAKIADASVVFCSSVSVYENQPGPWLESLPLNPASAYALSKLQSERLFSDLAAGSASLRISSPYGATHLWRSGVLFHFARLSVAGKQLTICGDGNSWKARMGARPNTGRPPGLGSAKCSCRDRRLDSGGVWYG